MLTRWMLRRRAMAAYAALGNGDPESAVRAFSRDARFVFPGSSAIAADLGDGDDIRAWFTAFARLRPRFEVLDVVCSGPPWHIRGAVRFRDHIGDDYTNEGVQYLHVRWGRITLDRIYLDTEAVAEWADLHGTAWSA